MAQAISRLKKVSILSTIVFGVFALVGNHYAAEKWMVPSLLAVVISIIVGNLALLWEYREGLPDVAEVHRTAATAVEARIQPLVQSLDKLAPRLTKVESAIQATNLETKSLEMGIRSQVQVGHDLVRILTKDSQGITQTRMKLSERGQAVSKMGSKTLDDVLRLFDVTKHGFMVHGEDLSLLAYTQFWREMLHAQREINKIPGNPDDTRLIARVTHSNEIELWMPEHNQAAQELLSLQKQFVEAGGCIIRLLLSAQPQPTELTELVRAKMISYGIETRHLHYPHPFEYDFVWISNPDIDVVLTWHSGQNGKGLSRCEVMDGVEPHIERIWERVGTASEDRDGPFETIPPGRHRVNL